jgi:hypothetical protein
MPTTGEMLMRIAGAKREPWEASLAGVRVMGIAKCGMCQAPTRIDDLAWIGKKYRKCTECMKTHKWKPSAEKYRMAWEAKNMALTKEQV